MTEALFSVSSLGVNFGGVMAVDGVSFEVDRGAILGIIGPNGAGKTTVFDAVCGFVPSRGRVVLQGSDITRMSPEARAQARLGRSFQDARLFPSLTVSECLAVGFERHIRTEGVVSTALRLPWVRRSERRVKARGDELIELMGLGAFQDKFVAELSTGSRRIVDLALTMAHDPLLLLLDEPSSGIAQRETEALGPLLLRIRAETGASLLVIEHDMPLITSISDEILALETGTVLLRGRPDEVMNDARLLAAYLGTDPAAIRRSGARVEPVPSRAARSRKAGGPVKRTARTRKAPTAASGATARTKKKVAAPEIIDLTESAPPVDDGTGKAAGSGPRKSTARAARTR